MKTGMDGPMLRGSTVTTAWLVLGGDGLQIWRVRIIFGPKRDEVTGEWRKLHKEELRILYSYPNIIRQIKSRRMRWAVHVARMGEESYVYRVLMGKSGGKRPL
jgi:hypothetical protein